MDTTQEKNQTEKSETTWKKCVVCGAAVPSKPPNDIMTLALCFTHANFSWCPDCADYYDEDHFHDDDEDDEYNKYDDADEFIHPDYANDHSADFRFWVGDRVKLIGDTSDKVFTINYVREGRLFHTDSTTQPLLFKEVETMAQSHPAFWYHSALELNAIAKKGVCPFCGEPDPTLTGYPELPQKYAQKHCGHATLPTYLGGMTDNDYNLNDPVFLPEMFTPRDPFEVQEDSLELWGINTGLHLVREAADFYLLEALSLDFPNDALIEEYRSHQTTMLADQFQRYLNMAIGGELRTAKRFLAEAYGGYVSREWITPIKRQWLLSLVGTGLEKREGAWIGWKSFQDEVGQIPALKLAFDFFRADDEEIPWHSNFGGKKWAGATQVLILYLTGELPKTAFVDTVWGLQHNTTSILNKVWNIDRLEAILDDNEANNMEGMVTWASKTIRDLWRTRYPPLPSLSEMEKEGEQLEMKLPPESAAPWEQTYTATTGVSPSLSVNTQSSSPLGTLISHLIPNQI